MSMLKPFSVCIGLLMIALHLPVQASVIVYTDRTAWETAVGSFITEDFNTLAPAPFTMGRNNAGLVDIDIIGLNGYTNPGRWNRIAAGGSNTFDVDGSTFLTLETDRSGTDQQLTRLIFDRPISGFAADWNSTTNSSLLTLTIGFDQINFSDYLTGAGDGFLGFVANRWFNLASFDQLGTDNEVFGLDNLSFSPAPVPTPSSLLLLALGLGGIGWSHRRRRKSASRSPSN